MNIDDDFLSLMDDSGDQREDIKVPEGELGEEIKVLDFCVQSNMLFKMPVTKICIPYSAE